MSSSWKTNQSAFSEHCFQGQMFWWLEKEKMQFYMHHLFRRRADWKSRTLNKQKERKVAKFWGQKSPPAPVTSPWTKTN